MTKIILYLTLAASFFITSNANATKINWTAGNTLGADWNVATNWDLGRVPFATDSVFTFYGDKPTISPGYTARCVYFKLLGTLDITVGGKLLINNGQFNVLGNVNNYGTITINNSPGEGMIFSTQAANVTFQNYGEIYIDQSVLEGIDIRNDQVFNNNGAGVIEVANAGLESLRIKGVFNNNAVLRLGTSAIGVALIMSTSGAVINNQVCGKMVLLDKFVISNGTLNNDGFFRQNYDGENDLQATTAAVNNNAVVEDIQGSFDTYDFDIQTIWLQPLTNIEVNTGESTVPMKNNFPLNTSYSNIYADNGLTQLAGTYNGTTNIWIPNANANGLSTFYLEITHTASACKDTVKFDLETPVVATTYWLGGNGSWQNPVKWSTGSTPVAGDHVGIYDAADDVFIPVSSSAFAKSIALSGKLTIRSMASLTINGGGYVRGIYAQKGMLINNGTLNVNNCTIGIDVLNGSFLNNQSVMCNGTSTCIEIDQATGFTSSLVNTGTVSNNAGDLIDGDETEIYNTGSLIGKLPIIEGVSSGNLINEGIIDIEGSGSTGTGVKATIVNEATGTILTKKLNIGAEIGGTNSGSIRADSCNKAIEISSTFDNLPGAEMRARYSTYGMILSNFSLNNKAGALVKITHSSLYGLYVTEPQQYVSAGSLFNDGLFEIDSTSGEGIYCLNDITNQGTGVINVKNSDGVGIHVYNGSAYLLNKDQGLINIMKSGGNGIKQEGGKIINEDNGQIIIDKSLLPGIDIKSYVNLPFVYSAIFENEGSILIK